MEEEEEEAVLRLVTNTPPPPCVVQSIGMEITQQGIDGGGGCSATLLWLIR